MLAALGACRGCRVHCHALTTRWLATKNKRGTNKKGAQKQQSDSDLQPLLNEAIVSAGFEKLRLVGPDGQQSVIPPSEAIEQARLAKMDLLLVAPEASPPVCKLVDYQQLQIGRKLQAKAQAKKVREKRTVLKEIRISEAIGQHDADLKVKQIRGFLKKNYQVTVSINNPKSRSGAVEAIKAFQVALDDYADSEPTSRVRGNKFMISFYPPKDTKDTPK